MSKMRMIISEYSTADFSGDNTDPGQHGRYSSLKKMVQKDR